MHRLCGLFPGVYPTGAQSRTLQRRVQLWRSEPVKRLIFQATGTGIQMPSSETDQILSVAQNPSESGRRFPTP